MDDPNPDEVRAEWTEAQLAAFRSILVEDWAALSDADLSLIPELIHTGETIATHPGSPNAKFWGQLVTIGWAKDETDVIGDFLPQGSAARLFRLTERGRFNLPEFIRARNLPLSGNDARARIAANLKRTRRAWRQLDVALGLFVLLGLCSAVFSALAKQLLVG